MVTDGMGPASLSFARSFKQHRDSLSFDAILNLDKHLIGNSRTRSSDSLITDSAAGATCFSCALKSYNGAIGVDADKKPCGTILEALKLEGYLTGLVVTTHITDATPAAFSAHADYRFQNDLIAEHQLGKYPLGRCVDLILGGGGCHFLPRSEQGGCREDNKNLVEEARAANWSYVNNRELFDALQGGKNVTLPLLGLLAPGDIPFNIDRDPKVHPSLAEQTKTALTALSNASQHSDKGFFLLIEGSRIDHSSHHNDPAAHVREVLAYDEAYKAVLDFVDSTDVETVVISTSDHETGGLVTARQVTPTYPDYLWYPQVLLNSTHSGEYLTKKILRMKQESGVTTEQLAAFIEKEIVLGDMGITDCTSKELSDIQAASSSAEKLLYYLNNMVSVRSQTSWTTHGHSAVDVGIYAYSNSERINNLLYQCEPYIGLAGNHENIEIGAFIESLTGIDLMKVTDMLKDTEHSPNHHNLKADDYHANAFFKADEYHANAF